MVARRSVGNFQKLADGGKLGGFGFLPKTGSGQREE